MSKQIQLFYAEWCGHCKVFKPEWEKLKLEIDKLKENGQDISYVEYESEQDDIMKKNNIQGYPTIRIKAGENITDYQGERTASAILQELTSNLSSNQNSNQRGGGCGSCDGCDNCKSGGNRNSNGSNGDNNNYKKKYFKYKAKYFKLLSEMEKKQ